MNQPRAITGDIACLTAADQSDAMFCLYRLHVIQSSPHPDRAAVAAIESRIERLTGSCPVAQIPLSLASVRGSLSDRGSLSEPRP